MYKVRILLITAILFCLAVVTQADDGIWEQETLTDGFWGLNDALSES